MGLFNVFDTPACLGDVEVIFYSHRKLWIFNPMGGLLVANGTAMYLFAGISFPIRLARHLMIRLNFSPGYYVTFTGNNDLGFPLEFRTSLKLAWIFRNGSLLGLECSHISNAGLGYTNPGTETMTIAYEIPLAPRKQKKSPDGCLRQRHAETLFSKGSGVRRFNGGSVMENKTYVSVP